MRKTGDRIQRSRQDIQPSKVESRKSLLADASFQRPSLQVERGRIRELPLREAQGLIKSEGRLENKGIEEKMRDERVTMGGIFGKIYGDHSVERRRDPTKAIGVELYKNDAGDVRLVVMVNGTNPRHPDKTMSWWRALQAGTFPNMPHAYMRDVQSAIDTYISRYPEAKGAKVTIAGFSQGGMIAQELARRNNRDVQVNGQHNRKSDVAYTIDHVVTFGSPLTGVPVKGMQYDMYIAPYDPVPFSSRYILMGDSQQRSSVSLPRLQEALKNSYDQELVRKFVDRANLYGESIQVLPDVQGNIFGLTKKDIFHNHQGYGRSAMLREVKLSALENARLTRPTQHFQGSFDWEMWFVKQALAGGAKLAASYIERRYR